MRLEAFSPLIEEFCWKAELFRGGPYPMQILLVTRILETDLQSSLAKLATVLE